MTIRFDGRVAIVTGAGNGLGRAHALGLASRGAKVVVNDFGGARDGTGGSLTPAETVVEEIRKTGGVAMADGADVSNFEQVKAMVDRATREWRGVDLLCANAGILRDKSFAKMEIADFARFLLARQQDEAWERQLASTQTLPRLESFLRESAAEGDEPLDPSRL